MVVLVPEVVYIDIIQLHEEIMDFVKYTFGVFLANKMIILLSKIFKHNYLHLNIFFN